MTSRLAVVAPVLLAGTPTLAGCGGDEPSAAGSSSSPTPSASTSAAPTRSPAPAGTTFEVAFTAGRVTGDNGRVKVGLDDTVGIVVTSDVADEVHLHGYDVGTAVAPGTPATLTFRATIPGVFQVELEDLGTQLLSIQVDP